MRNILIALSTILVLLSPLVYIHSIIRGETRPHRTTRLVILAITIVSTWSLIGSHWSSALWLAGASTAQALAVFILSIKHGYGGWAKLDIICLIIAVVGVIFWQITDKPLIGLYASILADIVGLLPTFVKTYHHPRTENWQFFAMDTFSGTLSLLAVSSLSAYVISYPIYIILINGSLAVLIILRQHSAKRVQ